MTSWCVHTLNLVSSGVSPAGPRHLTAQLPPLSHCSLRLEAKPTEVPTALGKFNTVHVHTYVYVCVYMYVDTIYVYVCMCICTFAYIIHVCVCVCVCAAPALLFLDVNPTDI